MNVCSSTRVVDRADFGDPQPESTAGAHELRYRIFVWLLIRSVRQLLAGLRQRDPGHDGADHHKLSRAAPFVETVLTAPLRPEARGRCSAVTKAA